MTSTITKRKEQYSETAIDDEIVVMSLDSGTFFSLTGTGRAIWELLEAQNERARLLAALAEAYAVDEAAIAGEFDAFIASLSEAGLVDCR